MERKDMLVGKADVPQRQVPVESEQKLSESVDEGASYLNMMESRGWKLLVKNFINPRSSLNRILAQPGGRSRDEATSAVAELVELMKYINGRITDGQKDHEKLEAIRKQRRT
jgi:hypothetical protein